MSNETEVIDETIEETQEEVKVEEAEDKTPTVEDYENLQKQLKTAIAQKEHFKAKAQKPKEEINKSITQVGLSREEAILFAKGLSEEDVELASKIAKINNISLVKATEDDYFVAQAEKRQAQELSKKAQLGTSSGGSRGEKPIAQMSKEEHEAYARKVLSEL